MDGAGDGTFWSTMVVVDVPPGGLGTKPAGFRSAKGTTRAGAKPTARVAISAVFASGLVRPAGMAADMDGMQRILD